jgi:uncharacterized alkaline shock family protein YloU
MAGDVLISDLVVAKLAGRAARATYGVVDMRGSPAQKVAGLFRSSLIEGVRVDRDDDAGVRLELHVVMERGVNVAQVTATLREQVRYEVERSTGMQVAEVAVRVEDLRE